MSRKKRKRRRSFARRYEPTPIPGLVLHPTVLLLNLVVNTAEDNAITDGLIPVETVDKVTAFIRHAYDLADLDRSQGKGVLISLIGHFFHPDDYKEHHIADAHAQTILDALQGDLRPQALEAPDLRTSNLADPATLSSFGPGRQARKEPEKTLSLYYKQRFLSFCFVGESAELDKLRGDIPEDLLNQVLGTLWQDLGIGDKTFVIPHPTFVPAVRVIRVSQQNAVQWAKTVAQLMDEGKVDGMTVVGPPGPTYVVKPKKQ